MRLIFAFKVYYVRNQTIEHFKYTVNSFKFRVENMQNYANWLRQEDYVEGTVNAQLYRIGRVQTCHGNLEDHYQNNRMADLLAIFKYTAEDEQNNLPNPTNIPINGNIRNNISSYSDAIRRYLRYRSSAPNICLQDVEINEYLDQPKLENISSEKKIDDEEYGEFELERSMQIEIRRNITAIQKGLEIIDNGVERNVDSGRIDITARTANQNDVVVIELKKGRAGQRAIAQILSYMGDIVLEEPTKEVRGILIASEFDDKAIAAARVIPTLKLVSYAVLFTFKEVNVKSITAT